MRSCASAKPCSAFWDASVHVEQLHSQETFCVPRRLDCWYRRNGCTTGSALVEPAHAPVADPQLNCRLPCQSCHATGRAYDSSQVEGGSGNGEPRGCMADLEQLRSWSCPPLASLAQRPCPSSTAHGLSTNTAHCSVLGCRRDLRSLSGGSGLPRARTCFRSTCATR